MANVVINSPTSVVVDGVDNGAVADCIANNPDIASDVQNALVAFVATKDAATQAVVDDYNGYKAVAQNALNVAGAALNNAAMNPLQQLAAVQAAFKIATTPATEAKRAQLQVLLAQTQAQLNALPPPPAPASAPSDDSSSSSTGDNPSSSQPQAQDPSSSGD